MWRIIPPVCAPHHHDTIQGWAKKRSLGLVNFVPVVDYHFYLAMPAAFSRALFWDAICLRGLQRSSDNNLHATAHIARAHLFCTPQFNVDPQVGLHEWVFRESDQILLWYRSNLLHRSCPKFRMTRIPRQLRLLLYSDVCRKVK